MSITVCVTGASGYIAGELVNQLLNRGYTVHGTVRSLNDPKKISFLRELPHANNRLLLFEADLLKEGSFDTAIKGCSIVFHLASPVTFTSQNPQKELIEPAIKGTLNVLKSIEKYRETVKRVVLVSSLGAVVNMNDLGKLEKDPNRIFDENDWNMTSNLQDGPYRFSKRLSEQEAWNWSKTSGIELVTILPSVVIGRMLNSHVEPSQLNFSQDLIRKLLSGETKKVPRGGVGFVDVIDVAEAMILASKVTHAAGNRYLCTSESLEWKDICEILRELNPQRDIPVEVDPEYPFPIATAFPALLSNAKITKDFGIKFRTVRKSLEDVCNDFIRIGLI